MNSTQNTTQAQLGAKTNRTRKQGGMSLPLMALFLGVGLLTVISAIVYGSRYFTRAKVANEYVAQTTLAAEVKRIGANIGTFTATNAGMPALVAQNVFPASMVTGTVASPVVTNQFGGAITVAVGTVITAGDSLVFTNPGFPNAACTELATSLDGIASAITVNGTATKAVGGVTNSVTVGTSCVNSDNNSIVVTFAK